MTGRQSCFTQLPLLQWIVASEVLHEYTRRSLAMVTDKCNNPVVDSGKFFLLPSKLRKTFDKKSAFQIVSCSVLIRNYLTFLTLLRVITLCSGRVYLGYSLAYINCSQGEGWLGFHMSNHTLGTVWRGGMGLPGFSELLCHELCNLPCAPPLLSLLKLSGIC